MKLTAVSSEAWVQWQAATCMRESKRRCQPAHATCLLMLLTASWSMASVLMNSALCRCRLEGLQQQQQAL